MTHSENLTSPLDAIMDHDIIVFTKSNCVQCDHTKRLLHKNDVSFHEMNLEDTELRLTDQRYKTAYEFVTEVLNAQAAPVVLVRKSHLTNAIDASLFMDFAFWTGFRPDFIKAIKTGE